MELIDCTVNERVPTRYYHGGTSLSFVFDLLAFSPFFASWLVVCCLFLVRLLCLWRCSLLVVGGLVFFCRAARGHFLWYCAPFKDRPLPPALILMFGI